MSQNARARPFLSSSRPLSSPPFAEPPRVGQFRIRRHLLSRDDSQDGCAGLQRVPLQLVQSIRLRCRALLSGRDRALPARVSRVAIHHVGEQPVVAAHVSIVPRVQAGAIVASDATTLDADNQDVQGEKAARRRGAGEQKHTRGRAGDSRALLPLSHLRRVPIACVQDIVYFAFLLSLFMYIYSMIGMQFFANRLRFDENGFRVRPGTPGYDDAEVPRSHFDTLLWAFTTIFQVLSGENWNSCIRYVARRRYRRRVYYISLILFGLFIVMNLFMATCCPTLAWTSSTTVRRRRRRRRTPGGETRRGDAGEGGCEAAASKRRTRSSRKSSARGGPGAESIFPLGRTGASSA